MKKGSLTKIIQCRSLCGCRNNLGAFPSCQCSSPGVSGCTPAQILTKPDWRLQEIRIDRVGLSGATFGLAYTINSNPVEREDPAMDSFRRYGKRYLIHVRSIQVEQFLLGRGASQNWVSRFLKGGHDRISGVTTGHAIKDSW